MHMVVWDDRGVDHRERIGVGIRVGDLHDRTEYDDEYSYRYDPRGRECGDRHAAGRDAAEPAIKSADHQVRSSRSALPGTIEAISLTMPAASR